MSGPSVGGLEESLSIPWSNATSTPAQHLPHRVTVNTRRASVNSIREIETRVSEAELGNKHDEPQKREQNDDKVIDDGEYCDSQNSKLEYRDSRASTLPTSNSTFDEALNWKESSDDCEQDSLEVGMGDFTEYNKVKKAGQYYEIDDKPVTRKQDHGEYRKGAERNDPGQTHKRSETHHENYGGRKSRYLGYQKRSRRVQFTEDRCQSDDSCPSDRRGYQVVGQRQQLGGVERGDNRRQRHPDHNVERLRGSSGVKHQHHHPHDHCGRPKCHDCANRPASWACQFNSPSPDYFRGYATKKQHEKRHRSAGAYDYSSYWRDYYNYYIHQGVPVGPSSAYSFDYHVQMYKNNPVYKQRVDAYYGLSAGPLPGGMKCRTARSGRSLIKPCREESLSSNANDGWNPDNLSTDLTSLDSVPDLHEFKIFSRPHPVACFCGAMGLLIKLSPSKRSRKLPPSVELHSLKRLFRMDQEFRQLEAFPGPLVRSETHKKDLVDFCIQKIKSISEDRGVPDRSSLILLWELLIIFLRQNGFVSGSNVSKLLLHDYDFLEPPSVGCSRDEEYEVTSLGGEPDSIVAFDYTQLGCKDSSHALDKFRQFLLLGHKKDALKWAVKRGLWGHALFLAAKMDPQTHASIMAAFTNALAMNDPLKTLHQHLAGRQPVSITFVADGKWGDWRPHLAMILSNPSSQPDVDARSIMALGDVLANRGYLPAAHFCYLMSQVEFGSYACKASKLVLLGSGHQMLPFKAFASSEAIQCTEIYEYCQSLACADYVLPHLQVYKFLHAIRLVDYGLVQKALHYCQVLAEAIVQQRGPPELAAQTYELANRLKYCDPYLGQGGDELEGVEPSWLAALDELVALHKQPGEKPCRSTSQYGHSISGHTRKDLNQVHEPNSKEYFHDQPSFATSSFANNGRDMFRPTNSASFTYAAPEASSSSAKGHTLATDDAPAECSTSNAAVEFVGVVNHVLPDEPPRIYAENQDTPFKAYKASKAEFSSEKAADKIAV
ncbi:protein transport protein Sec16B-like [Haemaphysalis longicornis]